VFKVLGLYLHAPFLELLLSTVSSRLTVKADVCVAVALARGSVVVVVVG